jgi:outer membrane immunogenic protein
MKRILGAGLLSLFAATSAMAADVIQPTAPPPAAATYVPSAPVYGWGGIYIGVNGGYGFGDSNWNLPAGSTGNFNVSGGLVGGTLGGNMQLGQFVYGVEGDLDWTDITGSLSNSPLCTTTCTFQTSNEWVGTVRGRVGYAFDRVMVYGTGGAAFGDVKATFNPGASSTNSTEFGWTAGAGVEFALTANLTAKAEYLFVDLSKGSCGVATPCSVSFDTSLVRAGLNFKFNPYY